jgi:HD superfamily phosphodiesterase
LAVRFKPLILWHIAFVNIRIKTVSTHVRVFLLRAYHGNSPSHMREQVIAWLAENVPSSRLDHILRVEQMAANLAAQYHLDEEKAATAGLMHDLAKTSANGTSRRIGYR